MFNLGSQTFGANETISILRSTVPKRHHVQHAIAIKWVISLERRHQWVFGIPQIHALQVAWNSALHHHLCGIELARLWAPRASSVWVAVVWGQQRFEFSVSRCH
jgi:hypothetical protein